MINGQYYDSESMSIKFSNLPPTAIRGVVSISYAIERAKTNIKGVTGEIIARSRAGKEPTGNISLTYAELQRVARLVGSRDITNLPPFTITVSYRVNGVLVTDVLKEVEFMSNGREFSDGGEPMYEGDLIISDIDFGA